MIGIQSSLQPTIVRACIGILAATGIFFTGVVSSTACVDNSKANNAESEWNTLVQIVQKISEESLNPPATPTDHSRVERISSRMQMEPDIETRNTDKDLFEQAVKYLVHQ